MSTPWTPTTSKEKEVVEIAKLLKPICRQVLVERKEFLEENGLDVEDLGIGSWHGSADMRVKPLIPLEEGTDIVVHEDLSENLNDSGDSVDVKAKCSI